MDNGLPNHVKNLIKNLGDVGLLLDLHRTIGGAGPGRRHGLKY